METKKLNKIIAVVMFLLFGAYSQSAFGQQNTPIEKPKTNETKVEKPKQDGIKAENLIEKENKTEKPEAEVGPSMQETMDFIQRHTAKSSLVSKHPDPVFASDTELALLNSTPSVFRQLFDPPETLSKIELEYDLTKFWNVKLSITLSDLDPLSVKVVSADTIKQDVGFFKGDETGSYTVTRGAGYPFKEHFLLGLNTTGGKQNITLILKANGKDKNPVKVSEIYFLFTDRETAKRVAKALQHAIKLSGGKVEPF